MFCLCVCVHGSVWKGEKEEPLVMGEDYCIVHLSLISLKAAFFSCYFPCLFSRHTVEA